MGLTEAQAHSSPQAPLLSSHHGHTAEAVGVDRKISLLIQDCTLRTNPVSMELVVAGKDLKRSHPQVRESPVFFLGVSRDNFNT